jgi:hypothetical protein
LHLPVYILIDDFSDEINKKIGNSILDFHKSYGVEVSSKDIVAEGLDF